VLMTMKSTQIVNQNRAAEVTGRIISYFVFISWTLITILPLFWMTYSSLKSNEELTRDIYAWPHDLFDNYDDEYIVIPPQLNVIPDYDPDVDKRERLIIESTTIAPTRRLMVYFLVKEDLPSTIANLKVGDTLILSQLPSKMRMKISWSTMWFNYTSSFIRGGSVNLTDTHLGIILVYTAFGFPLAVMLATQFMRGLPDSLVESAYIDGASVFRTFIAIILPMCTPVIITISIMSTLGIWNEFLLVLILASSEFTKSLPVGVYSFSSLTSTQLGWQLAALVIATAPAMVVYFIFNRRLSLGVVGGAVKG